MKLSAWWMGLATVTMPAVAVAGPMPAFPKAIQGIWMSDDDEGRTQCREYLAASKQDGVDASVYLVGAEIIRSTIWHSYAEYGEGNSYEILSVERLGGTIWRFSAKAYIDGEAPTEDFAPMISSVSLDHKTLIWNFESLGGAPIDSWDEHRYFRCSAVPSGLYGG